jgi:polyhydroxyalkanoate synthesis regulator phasin
MNDELGDKAKQKLHERIRRKLNQVLENQERYEEDKLVSYVAEELGVLENKVEDVIDEEIKEGEIYRPESNRIASINH